MVLAIKIKVVIKVLHQENRHEAQKDLSKNFSTKTGLGHF